MAISDKQFNHRMTLRRTTSNAVAIDVNVHQVEHFICHTIPDFTQQDELLRSIDSQIRGMGHRIKVHGVLESQEDILNAVTVLQEFLFVCSDLPAQVTFDVHTFIGQLKAASKDSTGATLSFTKALWIASCSEDIALEHTAAALHRMGQVYASSRHYLEARNVLEKALGKYKAAGVSNQYVSGAKRLFEEADKKWKESPESWSTLRSSAGKRLAQILE